MARFDNDISANIVALAVEKSLLEFGIPIFHKVEEKLRMEHSMKFVDAVRFPNVIADVLYEIFGTSYMEIVKSIERNMKEVNLDNKSQEFLSVIHSAPK